MALNPYSNYSKETLQPGARGEFFQSNIPGYRNQGDRMNRKESKLNVCDHDVPNIKFALDKRLPVLFRDGFAVGYNQIVIPKGRIVAVDPNVMQPDVDTQKYYNVLTLANGGKIVKLAEDGKSWINAEITVDSGVMKEDGKTITVDPSTGDIAVDGVPTEKYRAANKPAGLMERTEYTRDDDAFNGMQPGAILTDKMVELPLFTDASKAEKNPYGSAIGNLLPGDYLKADANGRLIPSPLNSLRAMQDAGLTTAAEIELERQQIVGQVYAVNRDLVPAGSAKYVQWALSDRMNFDQFNPDMWKSTGRRGEDVVNHSPYGMDFASMNASQSMTAKHLFTAGYPLDRTMSQHDLHMLASSLRKNDLRYDLKYQMENGIPGLTDGYNAFVSEKPIEALGSINKAASVAAYVDSMFKLSDVSLVKGSVKLAVTTKTINELTDEDFTTIAAEGQGLKVTIESATSESEILTVKYIDEGQGFLVLSPKAEALNTFLTEQDPTKPITVYAKFSKRGLAGVPTNLDWDGCQGTVKVLLQR